MTGAGLWQLTGDRAEELDCHPRKGLTKEISEKLKLHTVGNQIPVL